MFRLPFSAKRTIHIVFAIVAMLGTTCSVAENTGCVVTWPEWEQFKRTFITLDGRVVDLSGSIKPTVSEGQAYAMFFALVANDKGTFQNLLKWTENNLAEGDLTSHLPAWQWGQRSDNSWGIIDKNAAADADLWIAYTLSIAGEVWGNKRYTALSTLLAKRILNEETAEIPNLGLTLLPGPQGFALGNNQWKLNPSYSPLQLLRWFDHTDKDPRWKKLQASSLKVILGASPKGYTADWIHYHANEGFMPDLQGAEQGNGGYNAIRVYLWTGMLADKDSDRPTLLKTLQPMATLTEKKGYPPEFINIQTGEVKNTGSSGFSAALLPFLQTSKNTTALQQQQMRLQAQPIRTNHYYDQVLSLFAQGWMAHRFLFQTNGAVDLAWQKTCK